MEDDGEVSGADFIFDMDIEGVQVIELAANEESGSDDDSNHGQGSDSSEFGMKRPKLLSQAVPVRVQTELVQSESVEYEAGQSNSTEYFRGNFIECEFCQTSFRLKRDMRQHVKDCHPEVRFRCNICDKEFKYEESMYRHRVNVHPVKEVVVESNVEVRSSSHTEVQETTVIEAEAVAMEDSEIVDVYVFECSYCSLQFSLQSDLEEHLSTAHADDSENIESDNPDSENTEFLPVVKIEGADNGEQAEPSVEYFCDQCELCFFTNEDLVRHKSGHKQKQVFECGDCGKRFATERKVTRHLTVHQQFFCPMCNKMFKYNHVMRRHIRMCHASDSDTLYLCSGCDKTFGCPEQMKRHQLVHNSEEEKKFACDMCPMRFNYSHTLKRHKMGVHNLLPAEKMISCEFCGKVFKSKDMLKRHYRSHTNERPHICEHCSRAFQFAFVLRRHILAAHPTAMINDGSEVVLSEHPDHEVSVETEIG